MDNDVVVVDSEDGDGQQDLGYQLKTILEEIDDVCHTFYHTKSH